MQNYTNLYLTRSTPSTAIFDKYINRVSAFESARSNLITILNKEAEADSSVERLALIVPPIKYFLTREGIDI